MSLNGTNVEGADVLDLLDYLEDELEVTDPAEQVALLIQAVVEIASNDDELLEDAANLLADGGV